MGKRYQTARCKHLMEFIIDDLFITSEDEFNNLDILNFLDIFQAYGISYLVTRLTKDIERPFLESTINMIKEVKDRRHELLVEALENALEMLRLRDDVMKK